MSKKLDRVRWMTVDEDGVISEEAVRLVVGAPTGEAPERLIDHAIDLQALARVVSEALEDIQVEIRGIMKADEATEIVSPRGVALLRPNRPSYDPDALDAVKVLIPEEELVEAGALVPEHEETNLVLRKWNVTRLKPFGKRGKAIRKVIEGARHISGYRLEVKPNA